MSSRSEEEMSQCLCSLISVNIHGLTSAPLLLQQKHTAVNVNISVMNVIHVQTVQQFATDITV